MIAIPIIQFSEVDKFIWETRNVPADETCRVWPSTWTSGLDSHVRTVWHGITCQFTIFKGRGKVIAGIANLSIVIGSYQSIYGKPFGPQAERRLEVINSHSQSAQVVVEEHMINRLNANWRVAAGAIYTGLTGSQIQPAYWEKFDHIYQELKAS